MLGPKMLPEIGSASWDQELADIGLSRSAVDSALAHAIGNMPIGKVDPDGTIHDSTGFNAIGRVEAPHIQWTGAAYLLLIR